MSAASAASPLARTQAGHLRQLADDLNQQVAGCLKDSEEETVHRVRTGSRRVEAMLETLMRAQGGRPSAAKQALEKAAQEWFRQLRKVRRAAGEVRDLDVHRKIVSSHFLKPEDADQQDSQQDSQQDPREPSIGEVPSSLKQQADALDGWLKYLRQQRADGLTRQLTRRQPRLKEAEQAFFDALPASRANARASATRPPALLALEDFLRLVDRMHVLDAENLHDFRKGAKKARYVAETGGDEPQAAAVAKAIKRVQDDIGDWHDWLVLGEEAQTALGKGGAELIATLEQETARLFTRAMRTADRMRRRLLGEWLASKPPRARRSPKPPARAKPARNAQASTSNAKKPPARQAAGTQATGAMPAQ